MHHPGEISTEAVQGNGLNISPLALLIILIIIGVAFIIFYNLLKNKK